MQTVVKLKLSEFTIETLQKIQQIFSASARNEDPDLLISMDPDAVKNYAWFARIDKSIDQIKNGESKVFSIGELESFLKNEG